MVVARDYSLNKTKYLLAPELSHLKQILLNPRHPESHTRERLIIRLALSTGARARELLRIRRVDVNAFERTVFIRGLKGSRDRELPLAPVLFSELQKYMAEKRGEYLFDIGYHRLRQIWCEYRPSPKKFHCLRHTFAIELYKASMDLRLVQMALGHRSIRNTMIYAEYVYSQAELRKILKVQV